MSRYAGSSVQRVTGALPDPAGGGGEGDGGGGEGEGDTSTDGVSDGEPQTGVTSMQAAGQEKTNRAMRSAPLTPNPPLRQL